ncbi:MAG: lactate racemase domain-containing protein [Pseudomonadota bacterium]
MDANSFIIRYGLEQRTLLLPDHTHILQVREQLSIISPALFRARISAFLQENPVDLSRPVLVVADKTRLCGYPEYLPILVEELEKSGMDKGDLKIIIAYGTHSRQSDEECLQAYGELYDRLTFIHHDCRDIENFTELGVSARGVPIRFRQDLLDASAILTMGAISHHYFAGYGGGRKLIFPGCGERQAIYANHALYLDRQAGHIACGCQPGNVTNNPLALDLFEIEERLPVALAIHGILDSHGKLCELLIGRGREFFAKACAMHGLACETISPQFDLVVASCGGFPKDVNFIQSHKAVHNAAMFVGDGGLLLLYAQCRDDIGSTTFLPWFEMGGFTEAFKRLVDRYEGNGGTALAMMTKLQRIRIGLITGLDDTTCRLIGVERWEHGQVCSHLEGLGNEQSVACIPNASLLVRTN